MRRRTLVVLTLTAFLAGCLAGRLVRAQTIQQERYTYQRVIVGGEPKYTETYETREKDIDDNSFHTTQRRVTYINKQETVARLSDEKTILVAQAQQLQNRINDLNALP